MSTSAKIERVSGPAIGLRGDEIDTDRIIPARFLKTITFDGLGDHVFEDDRIEAKGRGQVHPFDVPAHQGARILIAQGNFGCGSSREHAPQALMRWGIGGIVAVSFAEIFFGNSLMIGLPCATVSHEDSERLIALSEAQPDLEFTFDVKAGTLTAGPLTLPVHVPDAVRSALVSGGWDATGQLLERYEDVERVEAALPYVSGWGRSA
jgi:3-isopropylmalate/(R)-2-methylmalate dehydratase small subunit